MALAGLVIATTGNLRSSNAAISKLVKDNGGVFAHMITGSITHLITTEQEVQASSYKVTKADEHGARLVTEEWLMECIKAKKRIDESRFQISKTESEKPISVGQSQTKPYFSYESDFLSEAEIKEIQQREEFEREKIRKQALSSASQPVEAAPVQKPVSSFGFATAPATGFGSSTPSSSTSDISSTVSTKAAAGGRVRRKPWPHSKGIAPKVKAWPDADPNRPRFTDDWEVEYFDILQWTDVKTNHNKYYCLELHIGKDKGKQVVRLYTHYGRTDDLVKNPKAGRRENRFYSTLEQAEDAYAALIEEKTLTKGYRKVELVFSNIGSDRLRKLVSEIAATAESSKPSAGLQADMTGVDLSPPSADVAELVRYIYEEASAALNNTLGPAKITSLGIETPLGVVNLAQIEKGERILQRLYEMFKLGTHDEEAISELTNQFYTMIPHNLGRQRAQISATRINSMAAFEEKQDLLQLMRDMLHVTAEGKTLGASDIDMKYRALRAKIEVITANSDPSRFEEVKRLIMRSPNGSESANEDLIEIKRIYSIHRQAERASFNSQRIQSNQQTLFHGSRISNYVGLLSRGLMMPKMVVAMGGKRRDGGLLGNGIYFGDTAATSAQYCTPGAKGTRLMLLNNVALGTVKDYEQVVFGLMEPPQGYHSVHGVRNTPEHRTDFKDDEYVIFNPAQQYQQYLVEFALKRDLDDFVTSQVFHNADGSTSVQLKGGNSKDMTATAASQRDGGVDDITATVDDIFSKIGSSAASTAATSASTSTTTSRLGGSYKSKLSSGISTFSTPFTSLLSSGTSSDALKLQPSTLQTTGLLKPSGLSVSSSGSNALKLQPSGLDTSAFSGSLKLQPSGLTTSVKVAPLGSSFGRKSAGQSDPYAAAPSNVIQLPAIDESLQSSSASGAAAVLQQPASSTESLTEEEKALKRAAMKMGGRNFGSRLATPAADTPSDSPVVASTNKPAYASTTNTTSPYSADVDAYSFSAPDAYTAPVEPAVTTISSETKAKKKRPYLDAGDDSASTELLTGPQKRPKKLPDSQDGAPKPYTTSAYSAYSSSSYKTTSLAATSTGFTSKISGSTKSYGFPSLSATTKHSTTLASTGAMTGLSASYSVGSQSYGLSTSASGLSGSSTALPSIRTSVTPSTTAIKLATLIPKDILKERLSESKIREMYFKDRTNLLLKDHAHLIDFYKKREQMRNTVESDEEKQIPKMLTKHRLSGPLIASLERLPFGLQYDPETQGDYCIVELAEFKSNLAKLTGNVFADLNMKNLVFFGDLVVGALLRTENGSHVGNDEKLASQYRSSDVEIAIVGLTGEAAIKKLNDVLFSVQTIAKGTAEIVRTRDEVRIIAQYPLRNVRIPLRFFKGPAEVLFSGDVDCACVGFDGTTVWGLPRAQRALTKRYNLADIELAHVTYEVNLYKWARRGFAVAVPGLQRHLVTPHLFKQKPWQVTGLAKLLLLEEEMNNNEVPFTLPGAVPQYLPWMPKHQRFGMYSRDEFSLFAIHEFQAKQHLTYPDEKEDIDALESDAHCNFFVPWGPQWRTSRVIKHLKYANAAYHRHSKRQIMLFGVDAVLRGSDSVAAPDLLLDNLDSSSTNAIDTTTLASVAVDASGIEWAPVSSTSATNSAALHWYNEAYCVEGSAVEITHAVTDLAFSGETDALAKIVRKLPRTVDLTHPSSYENGRSALAYASLTGNAEAISLLLSKGAQPILVDAASGLSPIHFAAFSGSATAVETLLRQPGVDINVKSRDQKWTPLHFACYYGNVDVLQVLVQDTKIRLNPRDKGGRTPVFVAAYAGHVKCLEMLKAAGAKMDTKAPKEETGVTALQVAAERGHAAARTLLVDLLKPEFPPMLHLNEEAKARISIVDGEKLPSEKTDADAAAAVSTAQTKVASAKDLTEWSLVDSCGQNLLHYAIKYSHVALVRQILQKAIETHDPRAPGLDLIAMPPELAPYKLIDIHAQNQYGQNALYYAQHLLDSFIGSKKLEAGDVPGTIEALGMPVCEAATAWKEIIVLLKRAGVGAAHIVPHRKLPTQDDPKLMAVMEKLAKEAKRKVDAVQSEKERREAELRAEEMASRPLHRTPVKRKTSNEMPTSGRTSPVGSSHASGYRYSRGSNYNYGGVRQTGPGFNFGRTQTPSAVAANLTDFANTHDVTQLLVTISQMHTLKQINDEQRRTLKHLALRKDRTIVAALKAFQQDHVSLVFGNTLKMLSCIRTH